MAELMYAVDGSCCQGGTLDLAGDKASVLAGAARVLRPGGRGVVSDVIAGSAIIRATRRP